uniref:Pentatricopeptide repeat-containing protein n=1 Tax=Timema tahoe TaxID=61484 RepID=A0A7R9IE00_9NEOP|nr:unnamed protein product [Timema tahoe]
MARYIRHVRSKLFSFQNQYLMGFENVSSNNIKGTRHLYSDAVLGVDNYVRTRERIQTQFATMSEKFKSKMIEFSEPSSSNMIFTEDLKNMVHLVEKDSSDDLNLVIKMLRRFNQQNKDLRFGNFVFGPVVMRMFYYMNTPDAALENTKESFEMAMDIWRELQTVGHIPLRRSATFAAALALNQNSPQYALEIISTVRQQNYITIRNIKMAALADLGRVDDALPILRSILLVDDPDQRKQSVTEDVPFYKQRAASHSAGPGKSSWAPSLTSLPFTHVTIDSPGKACWLLLSSPLTLSRACAQSCLLEV